MYDPSQGNQEQYQMVLEKVQQSRERLQEQLNDINVMMNELDEQEYRVREAMNKKK